MLSIREIEQRILANGKIDGQEIEELKEIIYKDGKVDRKEADLLVVLHKRGARASPPVSSSSFARRSRTT